MLAFFVDMVYTLRKRYAHAEHASGMLDVRYPYVKYTDHTWTYPGLKVFMLQIAYSL